MHENKKYLKSLIKEDGLITKLSVSINFRPDISFIAVVDEIQ